MFTLDKTTQYDSYWVIQDALPASLCALLCDYAQLKAQIKPNRYQFGDALQKVHREYADPMMETLLAHLTPGIEKVTGLSLWPTLSFYYVYSNGTQLLKHRDRNSCEWVAALCLGADEEYESRVGAWPLQLTIQDKPISLALNAGDLVLFKGHEIEHWREVFTGQWFTSAIFGFVDKNGPYAFQKFDQRRALGKPHVGMLRWLLGCYKHGQL